MGGFGICPSNQTNIHNHTKASKEQIFKIHFRSDSSWFVQFVPGKHTNTQIIASGKIILKVPPSINHLIIIKLTPIRN